MNNEALDRASDLLKKGIAEHNGLRLENLTKAFDEFEVDFGSYSGEGSNWIHYIRDFLESWIDASNHEWKYHDPIRESDWVKIANLILELLEQNKEFKPVSLNDREINQF